MSFRPTKNSRGGRGGSRRRGKGIREDGLKTTSDQDVLIAFAPFVRSDNAEALAIHARFQASNDQLAFVKAARRFLEDNCAEKSESNPTVSCSDPSASNPSGIIMLEEKMEGLTVKEEDPVVPMPKTPPPTTTAPPPGLASPIFTLEGNNNWALTTRAGLNTPPQPETPPQFEEAPETPLLVDAAVPPEAAAAIRAKYQPRRLWTRIDEQPGRILANNFPFGHTANVRPRQELTAQWMLPLQYLQKRARQQCVGPEKMTLQTALQHLSVGLFRRGCAENSSSIISKEIINMGDDHHNNYPYQVRGDAVVGTVPFYSPRTPGNVVLRLFWKDDPLYTLATGPTLAVKVDTADVEPTLRFILSNFKSKKSSTTTSLSSILSLTTVLESFSVVSGPRQGWEKAAWGCVCEARKVFEACGREYLKTKEKLEKVEKEVEELKEQMAAKGEGDDDDNDDELVGKLNEKVGALMGGRRSNQTRWRDAQLAYANMLKALATNKFCSVLAGPDLITRSKLELELWCPLCESFAPNPIDSDRWGTAVHLKKCVKSRETMQLDVLGFIPNMTPLEKVLSPLQGRSNQKQGMDPVAVEALNRLSASMGELYQREYLVSDRIHKQRELVRSHIESFVARCDAFPVGTRVVVFGSSANGFGSPSSDLDMCLQLPPNTKLADEGDDTGAQAMAKLAELFEEGGMKDVNTDRLTARIPIVMFTCPRPMASEDQDPMMECDVSMQNPLACLNTSLLLTYSQIHPVTRVLASIIKRWAKSRNINSPSDHTLSTYGYILMLLHFLTFHRKTGSGLVTTVDNRDDRSSWAPLLPNLQWMDPSWPESPPGTPYRELDTQPKQLMPHPLDQSDFVVNTYFYRLKDQNALTQLQQRFPGQDVSMAILLASFFRYYAYDFDYKRSVVSLNSTCTKLVEREQKAETDGWKVFWNGLSIEDPFETFYDVAHVVKGSNFHRIRIEFALAYTKIVNAAAGSCDKDLIDWICEPNVKPPED